MHRARQHAETRTRERRHRLAHEAARLMAEGGIRDFHQAKLKAAARLGIHDDASLPRNREIEDALREYQRIFLGQGQARALRQRREAAVRALEFLAPFGLHELHLLPFHQYGASKYKLVGLDYALADVAPPEEEAVEPYVRRAKAAGYEVTVGG